MTENLFTLSRKKAHSGNEDLCFLSGVTIPWATTGTLYPLPWKVIVTKRKINGVEMLAL